MRTAKDAFLSREWLAADADMRTAADASLMDGVSCDDAGCVVQASGGATVALTLKPEAFADDCARAAVIVTLRQPPSDCAAMVLDRETLSRRGTLALRKTADGYTVTAIRPRGVDRPWSLRKAICSRTIDPAVIPDRPRSGLIRNPAEFSESSFWIPGSLARTRAPE